MSALKTTAVVEDANLLRLEANFNNLKRGTQVNLIILIKQKNQLIDTADILIAATALQHSLEIATLNTGHFSRFEDLKIVAV